MIIYRFFSSPNTHRFPGYDAAQSQIASEVICFAAGALLLIQAVIDRSTDLAVERRRAALSDSANSTSQPNELSSDSAEVSSATSSFTQYFDADLDSATAERLAWSCTLLLQLTPACTAVVVSPETASAGVQCRYVSTDIPQTAGWCVA